MFKLVFYLNFVRNFDFDVIVDHGLNNDNADTEGKVSLRLTD